MMLGKLYIVPTPIGNLEDMTLRGIRILKECDLIITENIRISKKLLQYFKIKKKIESNNIYNEHKKLNSFISKLEFGSIICLISDSGTPIVSDPGYILVRAAIQKNIAIECLPGPTAFLPALIISSFPIQEFIFLGFLSKKKQINKLQSLSQERRTLVLYESPHRIISMLNRISKYFGTKRKISLSREISKKYEETFRGEISEVLLKIQNKKIKGEIVICIEGKNDF